MIYVVIICFNTFEGILLFLKLENILCDQDGYLKLTDFGFASCLDENHMFKDSLGSPNYMAPELIKKEPYTEKVDIWALGIIAYQIMAKNTVPFNSHSDDNIKE